MCQEEKDRILVYIRGMPGMNAHGASKSAGGQGKDGQFLLLFWPSAITAESQIQSRDHIPITAACFSSSLKNVQALYGQVKHSESLPRQMLSIAALRNRKDLAGYCLEQGARLDTDDIYDIHSSIIGGKSFTTCMFLVAKGLDINVEVEYLGDILSAAVEINDFSWVRFCLENGADPNLNGDVNTGTALASAARYASVTVASLLLRYDAKLVGSGALALAAQHGKLNMVKFLLKQGAFVDENCARSCFDSEEGTALHHVKKGRVDILKYLLESGANRNLTDLKGRTPLEKFLEMKDMKLMDALKDAQARLD
ncbi:hypothetical protein MMC31_003245 [Peltigera leucophlebia]|nr:hypothetical protein [Peltigera leucophlebia]